jgi:hypothetical protein
MSKHLNICVLREWILALFAQERFILNNCSGSVVLLIFLLLEKKGQQVFKPMEYVTI